MATFTASTRIDMLNKHDDGFDVYALQAIARDPSTYENETLQHFTARTDSFLFPTTVEVTGDFSSAGGNVTGGTVYQIDVQPVPGTGAAFSISGLSVDLHTLWNNLNSSTTIALATLLGGDDTVTGSKDDDTLAGFAGTDHINGRGGNDRLYGGFGDDVLSGGGGHNWIDGGDGYDTASYEGTSKAIELTLLDGGWSKVRIGGKIVDKLTAVENVTAGDADDHVTGNALANAFSGQGGDDILKGLDGNDHLSGDRGADKLFGGDDADELAGGKGNDILTGGTGGDKFVFDTALNATSNVDTVTDFTPGVDKFVLDAAVFDAISAVFTIGDFAIGSPHSAMNHIIYKASTGGLYYDADGNGAGKAVLFAELDKGLALSGLDFTLG